MWNLRYAVASAIAISYAVVVRSQIGSPQTTAQCESNFTWTFNNRSQSPCLVAAYLQATCFPDLSWVVNSLEAGAVYLPPNSSNVNACQCNTVTYNTLSACAACQQRGWVSFQAWVKSCPPGMVQIAKYPFNIPSGTTVPSWAWLDTSAGSFDANVAYDLASNTTGGMVTSNPSHSGLSTGAIVGIVVGIVIVLIVPLIVIVIYRRHPRINAEGGDYTVIQPPPTSPIVFSRRGPSGVESERPTSSFVIDKDTTVDGHYVSVDTRSPNYGQNPGGWSALFTRQRPGRQNVQKEDLGSAAGFTFVSSDGGVPHEFSDTTPPSTMSGRPYSSSTSRPHSHQYPPISSGGGDDTTTIYPSDSVSNLQLGNRRSTQDLLSPPQKVSQNAGRQREEVDTLAALAALEGIPDQDFEESDQLSIRTFSPPPQRSRLEKIPTSSPVMMYPGFVRGALNKISPP